MIDRTRLFIFGGLGGLGIGLALIAYQWNPVYSGAPELPSSGPRIYCLGDSITQANWGTYSWRYYLWKRMVDAGWEADFVGTISDNFEANPDWPSYKGKEFDADHDARWGWTANKMAEHLPGWLQQVDADVALIHIGTNDLLMGQGAQSTVGDVEAMIQALRADNPRMVIFVAQIIPASTPRSFEYFNHALPEAVEGWSTEQSPVHVVDMFTGYDSQSMNYDDLHPHEDGEDFMAERWFEALRKHGVFP